MMCISPAISTGTHVATAGRGPDAIAAWVQVRDALVRETLSEYPSVHVGLRDEAIADLLVKLSLSSRWRRGGVDECWQYACSEALHQVGAAWKKELRGALPPDCTDWLPASLVENPGTANQIILLLVHRSPGERFEALIGEIIEGWSAAALHAGRFLSTYQRQFLPDLVHDAVAALLADAFVAGLTEANLSTRFRDAMRRTLQREEQRGRRNFERMSDAQFEMRSADLSPEEATAVAQERSVGLRLVGILPELEESLLSDRPLRQVCEERGKARRYPSIQKTSAGLRAALNNIRPILFGSQGVGRLDALRRAVHRAQLSREVREQLLGALMAIVRSGVCRAIVPAALLERLAEWITRLTNRDNTSEA